MHASPTGLLRVLDLCLDHRWGPYTLSVEGLLFQAALSSHIDGALSVPRH